MARKDKQGGPIVGPDYDEEDALFEVAMGGLKRVPDKDGADRAPSDPIAGPAPIRRKLGRREQPAGSLDTLDLHGMASERALRELDGFVQRSRANGRSKIRVITGKGYRSEGGVPVLKNAVRRWITKRGKERIERVEQAPARLGGSGALILMLRPRGGR